MGYILAEAFTLLAIVSFTKGFLYLHRRRNRRPFLSRADRELFFRPLRLPASAPKRLIRYLTTFIAALTAAAIEMIVLAPFGAAILTGAVLVTATAIVQRGLTES